MTHIFDPSQLRFLILPTRFPSAYEAELRLAYRCWKEVWYQALNEEMNVRGDLVSDNFTRQAMVAAVLYKERVACLTTLNPFSLNSELDMDDSFFRIWPDTAKARLKRAGENIIACCNVTVHFDFRRGAHQISWKDLMFALLADHLKSTPFDAMVAAVRLEKGMDKVAYRTGADCIAKNLPYTIEGQRVDLVIWDRNAAERLKPEMIKIISHIKTEDTTIYNKFDPIRGGKNVA